MTQNSQQYQDSNNSNNSTPLDDPGAIRDIIMNYLVYNCFGETAKSFSSAISPRDHAMEPDGDFIMLPVSVQRVEKISSADMIKSMDDRKRIAELIINGNILNAISLVKDLYPEILNISNVSFFLHTQHYVELIRNMQQTEALIYAKKYLNPFSEGNYDGDSGVASNRNDSNGFNSIINGAANNHYNNEELRNILALIAYGDPFNGPLSYILDLKRRSEVAKCVNAAIIFVQADIQNPPLETLVKQLSVVKDYISVEMTGKEKKSILKTIKNLSFDELLQIN
jgi:hypothetical protein